VGFGGRILGPGEPKYLNSPETPIFHKGRQLYNLHHAKQAIRQEQVVIVVEGYFDVLRLVLAAIDHVVAPLGTALTPEQAALLKRVAPAAILLYDSDSAGLRATFRAGDELLRHGARVRVATLPPGEDPDTIVQKGGAAALAPILRDAIDVLERKILELDRRGWFRDVEHRREALDKLLPTVRAATDPITRELYLGLVAERSGVSRDVLERELLSGPTPAAGAAPEPGPPRDAQPRLRKRGNPGERTMLRLLLAHPDLVARARGEVQLDWLRDPLVTEVFSALLEGTPVSELFQRLSPDAASLSQELLNAEDTAGLDADATYAEALLDLEARPMLAAYHALRASRADDAAGAEALESRRLVLKRELAAKYPKQWKQYIMRTRTTGRLGPRPPRRSNAP